ncbi:unnamed protein product [Triticum turgidum subsp. durum]|uniref:DUF1664 domain-containing protein n=1 Tax=Triticum turgidum subsp. durum TaxID=4567 RepID=A0A9R0VEV2_TRITD|nr:unnamed protein product [Triticum turgidum subsp. durum]
MKTQAFHMHAIVVTHMTRGPCRRSCKALGVASKTSTAPTRLAHSAGTASGVIAPTYHYRDVRWIIGTMVTGGDGSKLPDLRDVLSFSFKFMKQDKKEGSSNASPQNDLLLSQVNYLRDQLQALSREAQCPQIINVNGGPGAGAYGLTFIAVGAIGYLYIRWKGWKISDMMFVTKRGLADACNVVGKQLDQVSESVHVTVIHGDLSAFQEEIQSVHHVVRTLETKLGRLAYTQDHTTRGIHELCEFTKRLDRSPKADTLKVAASTPLPAIESSEGITRTASLPSGSEPVSPVAQSPRADPPKVLRSSTAISASGLSMLAGTTAIPKRLVRAVEKNNLKKNAVINRATSMKEGVPTPEAPKDTSSTAATLKRPVSSSSRFGFLRGFAS